MATVAPFLLESAFADESGTLEIDPDLIDPLVVERQIAEHNLALSKVAEIPESVQFFVEGLADDVTLLPADATFRTDPYLLVALQRSLLAALRALENPDPAVARRELRIRLEQLRHVYRDLADARPIFEDRPSKELVVWLTRVIDTPQVNLADLLEVSPRTFQRWISEADSTEPVGDDARRVRIVANMVSHLRHALTGRGVIDWFDRPHPLAQDRPPRALLDDPEALPKLMRLAASTRSTLAA